MKNKVLVELSIPEIDEVFNVFLPVNRKIGNIIELLNKALFEVKNGTYIGGTKNFLYNRTTGERYHIDSLLRETDIRNGSSIVLL